MTGPAAKLSPQPGGSAAARAWPRLPSRAGAALFTATTAAWLVPLLRPHRRRLAVLLLISFAAAALGLLPPYISKLVIDRGLVAGDAAQLVIWSLALFGIGFLATGTGALSNILHMRASVRMLARMRQKLLSQLAAKPAGWFASQRAGELLARIDGDAAEVQKFAFNAVLGGSSALIRLVGGSAMLMMLDWRLGAADGAAGPGGAGLSNLGAAPDRASRGSGARDAGAAMRRGCPRRCSACPRCRPRVVQNGLQRRSLRDHAGLSQKLISQKPLERVHPRSTGAVVGADTLRDFSGGRPDGDPRPVAIGLADGLYRLYGIYDRADAVSAGTVARTGAGQGGRGTAGCGDAIGCLCPASNRFLLLPAMRLQLDNVTMLLAETPLL